MWYWNGMGLWGWLMMVALSGLVIGVIAWTIRTSAVGPSQRDEYSPLRILDERLARGEIEPEDHEERRHVLETHR